MWLVNHSGFGWHYRKHHHCYVSLAYKVEVNAIVANFFPRICLQMYYTGAVMPAITSTICQFIAQSERSAYSGLVISGQYLG